MGSGFSEVDRKRSGGGFSGALGEFLAVRLWICMVGLVCYVCDCRGGWAISIWIS